jgi:hypothetical protein
LDNTISIGNNSGQNTQGANSIAIGTNAGNIVQQQNSIAIGNQAGQNTQGTATIAIGSTAGQNGQSVNGISIGIQAGQNTQGPNAVAIGLNAGRNSQGGSCVAIGNNAGAGTQGAQAIAIGRFVGIAAQGTNSVGIGNTAAQATQGSGAVAIGFQSGNSLQGNNTVAVGNSSGQNNQGSASVAIGFQAGLNNQASNAIAIGVNAGLSSQAFYGLAVGFQAGQGTQGTFGIGIGVQAGQFGQGTLAVAFGVNAGNVNQGTLAIAIGNNAGFTGQHGKSIVINASGNVLNSDKTSATFINPIAERGTTTNGLVMYHDTVTSEVFRLSSSKRYKTDIRKLSDEELLQTENVLRVIPRKFTDKQQPRREMSVTVVDYVVDNIGTRANKRDTHKLIVNITSANASEKRSNNWRIFSMDGKKYCASSSLVTIPSTFPTQAQFIVPGGISFAKGEQLRIVDEQTEVIGFLAEELKAIDPNFAMSIPYDTDEHYKVGDPYKEYMAQDVNWHALTIYLIAEVRKLRNDVNSLLCAGPQYKDADTDKIIEPFNAEYQRPDVPPNTTERVRGVMKTLYPERFIDPTLTPEPNSVEDPIVENFN